MTDIISIWTGHRDHARWQAARPPTPTLTPEQRKRHQAALRKLGVIAEPRKAA